MREEGDKLYDVSQVEAGAADGAYIKSNVHEFHNTTLKLPGDSEWVPFQWDLPHQIDLCDGKAMAIRVNERWSTTLKDAQTVTKLFTFGKEH